MKYFKLSLVAVSFLMIGCGGGDSTITNNDPTPQVQEAKTLAEAQNNYKAMGAISKVDALTSSNSSLNKIQKSQSASCNKGGNLVTNISDDETAINMTFDKCQEDDTYLNGTMSILSSNDGQHSKLEFTNLTVKDSEMTMTSTHFVTEYDDIEYWTTLDGDLNVISQCFTGNFNVKTDEKIYDAQDGSDNAESGILELNGATYTFNNPYVTIKVGNEEKTLLQSDLEKEMNSSSSSCSE
jgi:hypothetical protein